MSSHVNVWSRHRAEVGTSPPTVMLPARPALFLWVLLVVPALSLPVFASDRGGPRLAPPESAACPPDRLTAYSGTVTSYRRATGMTTLRIRTDWDTTESVTLRHPGSNDPSRWFLIDRAPFTPADWRRIESAPGKLQPSMRAVAWVCSDGRPPIIDWQPSRAP